MRYQDPNDALYKYPATIEM